MSTLRKYTDVSDESLLKRKTGSKDSNSMWARARVARCEMESEMLHLGNELESGKISINHCKDRDLHPMYEDGTLFVTKVT